MTTRRAVLKAFGEYVDFCSWLKNAREGIDVDEDDPPVSQIAPMVKASEERWRDKLSDYLKEDV